MKTIKKLMTPAEMRRVVFDTMRSFGIRAVQVDYQGEGDDGYIEQVWIQKADKDINVKTPVGEFETYNGGTSRGLGAPGSTPMTDTKVFTIEELFESYCYAELEKRYPGWEISEGMNGIFQIYLDEDDQEKVNLTTSRRTYDEHELKETI